MHSTPFCGLEATMVFVKRCCQLAGFLIVLACALLGSTRHAEAALSCTVTSTDINFGNVNLGNNSTINHNATFAYSCTGGTANGQAYLCLNLNAGSGGVDGTGATRYMLGGANQLKYNIYSDGGHTTVWGSTTWGLAPTPPLVTVGLDGSGNHSGNLTTLNGQIMGNQSTLPAGAYVSTFSGSQIQFAYADTSPTTCAALGLMNLQSVSSFNVLANYNSGCFVTATTLGFGTTSYLTSEVDATNTVSVTCTNGVAYTISLDGGLTGASNPTLRKMANGGTQITYGIYQNVTHTTAWGNTIGTNTEAGTGTGLIQNYTAYGAVPIQTSPAPAVYSDTVTVTVTY